MKKQTEPPIPTLENWIKFKEEFHAKQTRLSFSKKLKILANMIEMNQPKET